MSVSDTNTTGASRTPIDHILAWLVRRPGCRFWSEHRSLAAARRELPRADAISPGHQIMARHASGRMTGPY